MSDMIRVLVVSKNETLKRNMEEWFHQKVEAGRLYIDFAGSRDEAEHLMSTVNYDKIFHNGIYVIDAIERLQVGADVYLFGKTNNNLDNYVENPHDRKKISRIFSKNYLKTVYNIGGLAGSAITILIALIAFIAFGLDARGDIDYNATVGLDNKKGIEKVDSKVEEVKKEVDRVGDVAEENNTILRFVYKDEINKALPKKNENKSTIGDNND